MKLRHTLSLVLLLMVPKLSACKAPPAPKTRDDLARKVAQALIDNDWKAFDRLVATAGEIEDLIRREAETASPDPQGTAWFAKHIPKKVLRKIKKRFGVIQELMDEDQVDRKALSIERIEWKKRPAPLAKGVDAAIAMVHLRQGDRVFRIRVDDVAKVERGFVTFDRPSWYGPTEMGK